MAKITIVQGHPDGSAPHYCHALGEAYQRGAEGACHSVRVLDIGKNDFPILRSRKEWEAGNEPPFILEAREAIKWADHVVWIYPLWMGTMPAYLKSFIEHVFSEEFAFAVDSKGWHSKLKGRSARIVVTMGMPAAAYRYLFFAHSLKNLRRNILGFSGFSPIRDSVIGMVEAKNPKGRERWLAKLEKFGAERS